MAKLSLSIATGDYDRVRPLADGGDGAAAHRAIVLVARHQEFPAALLFDAGDSDVFAHGTHHGDGVTLLKVRGLFRAGEMLQMLSALHLEMLVGGVEGEAESQHSGQGRREAQMVEEVERGFQDVLSVLVVSVSGDG